MADLAAAPVAPAAPAAPGGTGSGSGSPTPPAVSIPSPGEKSPSTGVTDPSSGDKSPSTDSPQNPTKFKFKFDDTDATETEVDFSDIKPEEAAATDAGFKFEQLDAIKESNPDLYKSLKAELSKAKRYGEFGLKSPEEYKTQSDRISNIATGLGRKDGSEGLDAIERTLTDLADAVTGFHSGNKDIIAKTFENNPNAAAIADAVMENWAKTSPEAANAYWAKKAIGIMTEVDPAGMSAAKALTDLYGLVKDNKEAVALLQRAAYSINKINESAQWKPDPNLTVQQKDAEFAARDRALWVKETEIEVAPIVRNSLRKGLSALTSEMKRDLSPEERTEFLESLEKSFYTHASRDQEFGKRLNELEQARDREGIKKLINQAKGKYVTFALKDLYRSRFLNRTAIKQEAANKTEASGGGSASNAASNIVQYTGKMKHGAPDVAYDYDRMRAEDPDMLFNHQFYIRGRKEKFTW